MDIHMDSELVTKLDDIIGKWLALVLLLFERTNRPDATLLDHALQTKLETGLTALRCYVLGVRNMKSSMVENLDTNPADKLKPLIWKLRHFTSEAFKLRKVDGYLDTSLETLLMSPVEQLLLQTMFIRDESNNQSASKTQDIADDTSCDTSYVMRFDSSGVCKVVDAVQFLELGSDFDLFSPKVLETLRQFVST